MTTPFVDEMYDLLKNTLTEYEVIICRWPEYIFVLENVCVHSLADPLIDLFASEWKSDLPCAIVNFCRKRLLQISRKR